MKRPLSLVVAALLAVCLVALVACGGAPGGKPAAESATDSVDVAAGAAQAQPKATDSSRDSSSALRVSFIDVGKGDCALVQVGNTSVLIDTGYEKTADNVLRYLREQHVGHLDAMVITHYDRDHIGGIRKIGEGVDVDTIYLPGYAGGDKNYRECVASVKALEVPAKLVTKETSLNLESARFTIYPSAVAYKPGTDGGKGGGEGNDNDASLVATLANGRDSYLFAGDLEEAGIGAYLAARHGRFDVLKMPHHGHRSSNTAAFIDDVCPQIVVITDAKDDPANKKVLKLLQSDGIKTYRTSNDGTVVVESSGNGTYAVRTLPTGATKQ
ncbi:MAG: MBL fold metallo-hydrolase [Coriobacteriales bacterium]|nr:MBL fold metallo-hydrolase [Coriobacteriales bacterium]